MKEIDKIIKAEDIIKAIDSNEDINLVNVTIEGDLDLNKLEKIEPRPVKEHLEHLGDMHIYGLCSSGARVIKSSVDIEDSTILGKIKFGCCIFEKDIKFWNDIFNKDAIFEGSIFRSDIWFSRSRFLGYTTFRGSKFVKCAEFLLVEFDMGPDFSFSRFNSYAYFCEAIFSGITRFNSAKFFGELSFENSSINVINLNANFMNGSTIILKGSNFSKLLVTWNLIKNRISINPDNHEFDKNLYFALIKDLIRNFESLGQFDDADSCYLEYKKIFKDYRIHILKSSRTRSKIKKLSIFLNEVKLYLFDWVSFWFYGHGVNLLLPIALSFVILFVSFLIYYYGGQADIMDGIKLSLKIFISSTQVQNQTGKSLTGLCEWWSIMERFLGAILIITSTVILARKALR